MAESKEPLRDKLIVAVVQTLIFGALLAVIGYWLNHRLETYKQALADQSEKTKALISFLEPHIQQRRAAYFEFQQAAREAKNILEVYYFRAKGPPEHNARRYQLRALENKLGIGSGGSSGSWATHGDAVSVVEKLVVLREKYEDVSSDKMNSAVDDFIDTIMQDLREGAKDTNDNEAFHNSARTRVREAFVKLNDQIAEALGLDQLPLH